MVFHTEMLAHFLAASDTSGVILMVLVWIRENPLTFLTGLMTFVTALYARATTMYVQILVDQLAAQIEPGIDVRLENGRWLADEFRGTIVFTASSNTLVLDGGDILLRCEHGSIRVATRLTEWIGHSLTPGQNLAIDITVPFQHPTAVPHAQSASIEGFIAYKDGRNLGRYQCDMLSGGYVSRHRQSELGRIRLWLATKLYELWWRLTVWQMGQRVKRGTPQSIGRRN